MDLDVARRISRDGFDLVIFRISSKNKILKKLKRIDWLAECPPQIDDPGASTYAPPLDRLITLGDSDHYASDKPPAYYRELSVTSADIPELARMFNDAEIIHMDAEGGYCPPDRKDTVMDFISEPRFAAFSLDNQARIILKSFGINFSVQIIHTS